MQVCELTVDYPSNHPNGRVPILDLEVWMERTEEGYQQVMWSFYEKPMKNKCVLMRTSAVPEQTRRSALVNEVVRRLRNCHEDVKESEVADVLSRFSQKMRNSGYYADYRRQIISAGIKAHKEQKKREEAGGRPMFRTRNFEKDKRRRTRRERVDSIGGRRIRENSGNL